MEIFGLSFKGVIRPNVRVLFLPAVLVSFLLILSFVIIPPSISRVSTEARKLDEAKKKESLLIEKFGSLQQLQSSLIDQTDQTVIALPEENPSITMLIQLSSLVEQYSLSVLGKEVGSPVSFSEDLSKTPLSITVGGNLDSLIEFIGEIDSVAPVSTIDEMSLANAVDGSTSVTLKLSVYFSKFPEKLPPLSQPVKTLTDKETETLNLVSSLKKPELVELTIARPEERQNPFGFE